MFLTSLLFPRRCASCGKVGEYLCVRCLSHVEFLRTQICPVCMKPAIDGATHPRCSTRYSLDGLTVVARFTGPVKDYVHLIKYRFVSDAVSVGAKYICDTIPWHVQFDLLIPVPLHISREHERGFNQSAVIADRMGKLLCVPVIRNNLIRRKKTLPQVGLKREKRLKNVLNAFGVRRPQTLTGKNIGLIDDVTTTITTLTECAKTLKINGAASVWGAVLAHG
jgi:ComF family protein